MGLPRRYRSQISVAFSDRQRVWLDQKAAEDEMSLGEIMRGLVDEAIAADDVEASAASKRRSRARRVPA
jgi:hypothetical protein